MSLPNEVVGQDLPASIGPLETTLTVHSYELERIMVAYKADLVHVRARGGGDNRIGGVIGDVRFTVSVDEWRRLNRVASDRRQGSR